MISEPAHDELYGLFMETLSGEITPYALELGLKTIEKNESTYLKRGQHFTREPSTADEYFMELKASACKMPRLGTTSPEIDAITAWYTESISVSWQTVVTDAWKWAKHMVAEHPGESINILTSSDFWVDRFSTCLKALALPSQISHPKHLHQQLAKIDFAQDWIVQWRHKAITPNSDARIKAQRDLLNALVGGARPLVLTALADHYKALYRYVTSVLLGAPAMYVTELADSGFPMLLNGIAGRPHNTFIEKAGEPAAAIINMAEYPEPLCDLWQRHLYLHTTAIGCIQREQTALTAELAKQRQLREDAERRIKQLQAALEGKPSTTTAEPTQRALEKALARIESLERQLAQRAPHPQQEPPPDPAVPDSSWVAPPPPALTFEENLDILRKKRVMLIGGHLIFTNKVKHLLPHWEVVSAKTKSIPTKLPDNVEMVLCFNEHCGHPLFEAVVKLARQRDIPFNYVRLVNPAVFLADAAAHFRAAAT